jgi:hypothetical protein
MVESQLGPRGCQRNSLAEQGIAACRIWELIRLRSTVTRRVHR